MSTILPSTVAPVNPTPTLESEPPTPVTLKRREPFKPKVDVRNFLEGLLPSEYVSSQTERLQDPSPIKGNNLTTDGVAQKAIMTYLEENPGLKQELISTTTKKLKLKPGDQYYESALLDQLTRDAYRPVVDSMRIRNIRTVGKAVIDEVEKYVKYMKLKGRLEKTVLGQHTYSFNARKDTLGMTRYSAFADSWQSAEGRAKLMDRVAEDNQEGLREFITAKLADEQFVSLPRQEQMKLLDSAMHASRARMQRLGEKLLERNDAVGGIVLDIAGGWTEKAESQFDNLAIDQRVVKGVKRIYADGGDIILTDGVGADLPRFVRMGPKHAILEVGTSDLSGDGSFASYKGGPDHVLGQMVGVYSLIPPSSVA